MPVTIKNGEQPKHFLIVILSAQSTFQKNQYHFARFFGPQHLVSIWIISQCSLSILLFAFKLYGDMQIPFIPYFYSSHFTAARKTEPLSVAISSKHPHLQMTSSKSHKPMVLAVSLFRGHPSTQLDKAHLPWTIYLQPFNFGVICTVDTG